MNKNNIISGFIILLIFILGIFHSQLFGYLGYENLIVDGNYEYTKVMLFNILLPITFTIIIIISNYITKQKINISIYILFYLIIIVTLAFLSTYFSLLPNVSFFGGTDKGHGLIFNINLTLFFILVSHIFLNTKSKILLKSILLVTLVLTILGIKEYYLPSYNYGDLGNRLISTLGHPNYISALYIITFPYLINLLKNYSGVKKYISFFILLLFLFGLLLTKSYIAIFLILSYIIFELFWKFKTKYYFIFLILLALFGLLLIFKYYPEKLNSLVSRYYIWETTINIIFSDIKIFFFGIGSENLSLLFGNFKSTELYLYENIGFNADRPHNIFLNIWVHYGIFLVSIFIYLFYKLIKNIVNNHYWYDYSLLLIIIFWCFNFPNIIGYIFFILILTYKLSKTSRNKIKNKYKVIQNTFILLLLIISIIGSYYSIKSYQAQVEVKQDNYSEAEIIFPFYGEYYYNNYHFSNGIIVDNNFYSEKYYLYKLYFSFEKIPECNILLKYYPSIENYFYCGEIIENKFGFHNADYFYRRGIKLFPDIWDNNSIYLNSFPGKYIINTQRVLHEKYSNIQEILRKIELNKIK